MPPHGSVAAHLVLYSDFTSSDTAYGGEDLLHVHDARHDTVGLDLGQLRSGHGRAAGDGLGLLAGCLP